MRKSLALLDKALRRVSHPVFYIALLFSALMWFVTKMSIEYRETIIIPVEIEGESFNVACNVQGTGYRLLINNLFPEANRIPLTLEEVGISSVDDSAPFVHISPYALYNAITGRVDHLRVLNVSTSLRIKRNTEDEDA